MKWTAPACLIATASAQVAVPAILKTHCFNCHSTAKQKGDLDLEKPAPGQKASPLNDWEFSTRLSYFLWPSAPDEDISQLDASGELQDQITPQTRRMMKSDKIRRLATEFGCMCAMSQRSMRKANGISPPSPACAMWRSA